jgi:hypothetical protein
MAAVPLVLPTTLPSVQAMPGDVRTVVPALSEMMVHGGINILVAIVILIVG